MPAKAKCHFGRDVLYGETPQPVASPAAERCFDVVAPLPSCVLILAFMLLTLAAGPAHVQAADGAEWTPLFDGKSLEGWLPSKFGGEGDVTVEEGKIVMEFGDDLTGITIDRDFPKMDYEIRLEAMRIDGHDFFCGLTFPYGDSPCSLIVGGWGGVVVGLSSIDNRDASENETMTLQSFDSNKWYRIRLSVTKERIKAWIDDKQVVDQKTAGHKISIRPEVDPCRPMGIACWRTKAALRKISFRKLPLSEAEAAETR